MPIYGLLKGDKEEMNNMKMLLLISAVFILTMCIPPESRTGSDPIKNKARLDSLRQLKCPRLMSSAAEYYRNRDWEQTVQIYSEITSLDCDEWDSNYAPPQEIYLYYAIAYEQMSKFDSSEYVLLDGLQKLPNSIELRKRLAYSYKRQGKLEKEIIEYERLADLTPDDISVLNDLSKLLKDQNRYEDQILILENILRIDQNNEIAQGELAMAYENSGKDPLDVYRRRYEDNRDNVSYGLDYSDRLIKSDRIEDAIVVLREVINIDPTSKLSFRKLADVYKKNDMLDDAVLAYTSLFKIDPRDERVSIEISNTYIDLKDFESAIKWADKSIDVNSNNGATYAQKAKVYFYGWDTFRNQPFSVDDRILAKLSYNYFLEAEKRGYKGFNKKDWFEENAKDVLYGKAQWFMAEDKVKRTKKILPKSNDYNWVLEPLSPEANW